MLEGEHSAILSTFIKLPFSIKTFVLSIFKRPLKTGFTVNTIQPKTLEQPIYFNYLVSLSGLACYLSQDKLIEISHLPNVKLDQVFKTRQTWYFYTPCISTYPQRCL